MLQEYFCPLSVDIGNVAEWVQALAAIGAVVAAIIVWRRQADANRKTWADQTKLTIETQRQALRPHLSLSVRSQTVSENLPHLELILESNGLGPAIVKSVGVFHNGKSIQGSWEQVAREALRQVRHDVGAEKTMNDFCPSLLDDWISPGRSIRVFQWRFYSTRPSIEVFGNEDRELRNAIEQLRVDIQYESTFEENLTVSTHTSCAAIDTQGASAKDRP